MQTKRSEIGANNEKNLMNGKIRFLFGSQRNGKQGNFLHLFSRRTPNEIWTFDSREKERVSECGQNRTIRLNNKLN